MEPPPLRRSNPALVVALAILAVLGGLALFGCAAPGPDASEDRPASRTAAPAPADPTAVAEPTAAGAPSSRPAVDLPPPPWTVHDGMELLGRLKVEPRLDAWAKGRAADFDDVARAARTVVAAADRIDWTGAKGRARNPGDFDAVVRDLRTRGERLGEIAARGDAQALRGAADAVAQTCADCHTLYQ